MTIQLTITSMKKFSDTNHKFYWSIHKYKNETIKVFEHKDWLREICSVFDKIDYKNTSNITIKWILLMIESYK